MGGNQVTKNARAAWAKIRENILSCESGAKIHHSLVHAVDDVLRLLPTCPKCGAEDAMEHVKTEYHNIETHYDECMVCGYRTDPE